MADDHAVVRTGYRRLLELEEDMEVVADFSDSDSITILRAEASVLRRRGYGVHLHESKAGPVNIIGYRGQVVGVRLATATWFASGLDPKLEDRFERDMREVQEAVQIIVLEERARVFKPGRPCLDEPVLMAIWRRARDSGAPERADTGDDDKKSAPAPASAEPAPGDQTRVTDEDAKKTTATSPISFHLGWGASK